MKIKPLRKVLRKKGRKKFTGRAGTKLKSKSSLRTKKGHRKSSGLQKLKRDMVEDRRARQSVREAFTVRRKIDERTYLP